MRVRTFVTAFGIMLSLGVASCSTSATTATDSATVETSQIFSDSYGKVTDSGYALPAIPINRLDKKFHRQIVSYETSQKRGTIVVDTKSRFLYYVIGVGKAVRYGRPGIRQRKWPSASPK
jgi:lipoprotein-anchoring transpeptidase ErfK/SrfK